MKKSKPKRNLSLKRLRQIIGRTQTEFAAMIGASRDAVISWENGRNPLSERFLPNIYITTGVDLTELLKGDGPVLNLKHQPYLRADFEEWTRVYHDPYKKALLEHFEPTGQMLREVFEAAARPGPGKLKDRFLGVLASFISWQIETVKKFRLQPQIDELRDERIIIAIREKDFRVLRAGKRQQGQG